MLLLFERELKAIYNLNKAELNVFLSLLYAREPLDMATLVKGLNKDRTSLQRVINKLESKGFIIRTQQNLHKGFKYLYALADKNEVISDIEETFVANLEIIKSLKQNG